MSIVRNYAAVLPFDQSAIPSTSKMVGPPHNSSFTGVTYRYSAGHNHGQEVFHEQEEFVAFDSWLFGGVGICCIERGSGLVCEGEFDLLNVLSGYAQEC